MIWWQKNVPHKTTKGMKFPDRDMSYMSNPEVREKMSNALKGRKFTPEWIAKMAKSRTGIKMSIETRLKMRESQLKRVSEGRHNNYKGGIELENDRIRKSCQYRIWRDSVFKRDDYTCQICLVRSGNGKKITLNADHIKRFAEYPELRFDINNGRTLCKDCHKKVTSEQGKLLWKNQYCKNYETTNTNI